MPLLQLSPARVISFSKCIDIKCKTIIYSGWTIIIVVVVIIVAIVIIVDVIIIVIVHNMTPFPSEENISAIILVIHCVGRLLRLLLLTIWTSICVSLQICSQIVLCVSSKNSTIPVEEQQGVSR